MAGSRSRGGCKTCRLRKVKCDEGQPSCQRCLRSQRTCEGYDIPKALIFDPDASRQERRSLHLLREQAGVILEAFHEDDKMLWHTVLFQASHGNEVVRQGAVSLSSYYESLVNPSGAASAVVFARKYYGSALSKAAAPAALERLASLDEVLVLSLLLHVIELFRHHFTTSYVHLAAAKDIVDRMTTAEVSRSPISGIVQRLRKRIDNHVDAAEFAKASSKSFAKTEDAWRRLMQIQSWICNSLSQNSENAAEEITTLCQRFHLQLFVWRLDFADFCRTRGATLSSFESKKVQYLQILHGLIFLALSTVATGRMGRHGFNLGSTDETVRHVLEACSQFANSGSRSSSFPRPIRFGFDIELILIVLYLGSVTTDRSLRQEAIDLLRTAHRREGSWDSFHAAHVIECLDHADPDDIAILSRVAYFHDPSTSVSSSDLFEFARPGVICCCLSKEDGTEAVIWFRCNCDRNTDCGSTTWAPAEPDLCLGTPLSPSNFIPVYEQTEFAPSIVTQILWAASHGPESAPAHPCSSTIFVKEGTTIALDVP